MKACNLLVASLTVLLVLLSLRSARAACTTTPRSDCRLPFTLQHSSLNFRQTGKTDPDDIFTWKWKRGSRTVFADFGPFAKGDYVLCIYDQSARVQPVVEDPADDPSGWGPAHQGFIYRARSPHALRSLRLRAGDDGKANISAHGDSDTVNQLLPFSPPVIVQLQTGNGACWETDFSVPNWNTSDAFRSTD